MSLLSMRARKKLWGYTLALLVACSSVIAQTTILNNFPVFGVYCNLPLTLAIVWGAVFGSPLPPITPDELRLSTTGQIFLRQLASGSVSGALLGALIGSLVAPMILMFPIYLPLAGWSAGYFCLRNINRQYWLSLPLVFVITLLAEMVMAWQLTLTGHHNVFDQLIYVAIREAALNTTIAPFIYFPMRHWYEIAQEHNVKAVVKA